MRKRQHARTMQHATKHEPADQDEVCQHESHVRPSIPRATSHQLMPRESASRSRLRQWCSGVADASREIVVLQAAILAPSSCHCFEPCENALASWSGLSAMYVRHGGASRLALVPQLQLCVTWTTPFLGVRQDRVVRVWYYFRVPSNFRSR